jgi:HrpA-like RNA helicase
MLGKKRFGNRGAVLLNSTPPAMTTDRMDATLIKAHAIPVVSNPMRLLSSCINPPDPKLLRQTATQLERAGALKDGELSNLGRTMSMMPLDPPLAKLVAMGKLLGCSEKATTLACIMSEVTKTLHGEYIDEQSLEALKLKNKCDFATSLEIYKEWKSFDVNRRLKERISKQVDDTQRLIRPSNEIKDNEDGRLEACIVASFATNGLGLAKTDRRIVSSTLQDIKTTHKIPTAKDLVVYSHLEGMFDKWSAKYSTPVSVARVLFFAPWIKTTIIGDWMQCDINGWVHVRIPKSQGLLLLKVRQVLREAKSTMKISPEVDALIDQVLNI